MRSILYRNSSSGKFHQIAESTRAGVVDENVDATELFSRLGNEFAVVRLFGDICLYSENFSTLGS